jgi:predicted O-methyltransferase YrrM
MIRPKLRHLRFTGELLRVTKNPVRAYHGFRLGRIAVNNGAMQKLSEIAQFLAWVGRPRRIIEIGAGRGGTLRALCAAAAPDATIISVDLEGGPFGVDVEGGRSGVSDQELRERANAKPGQRLYIVRGRSSDPEILDRVRTLVPDGVDLLFIDGDHTYEGVSDDYRLYSPLVAAGGVIAFHDVLPHPREPECQVHRFWRALPEADKHEFVSSVDLTWGGIGAVVVPAVPAVSPPASYRQHRGTPIDDGQTDLTRI